MGLQENRKEEQRIWKNRLSKFFSHTSDKYKEKMNISEVNDLKNTHVGQRLKNNNNPWYHKRDDYQHISKKLSNNLRRRESKDLISREVNDLSEAVSHDKFMKLDFLYERLKEVNYYIESYDNLIKEKYELEKEISFLEYERENGKW